MNILFRTEQNIDPNRTYKAVNRTEQSYLVTYLLTLFKSKLSVAH